MQGMGYAICCQGQGCYQQSSLRFWNESMFCTIEKVYGMVFGLIWWLKPRTWNLTKVRMELLERQQSQERCKSGPKVNFRAVKYSNLWIPSERFMKLEWQPIKKKRMEGWKQILQTKWSSKTFLKHGSILSIVQTTHRVPFATFMLVNCQVLTNRSRLVQNKWLHSRDHYQIVFDQR